MPADEGVSGGIDPKEAAAIPVVLPRPLTSTTSPMGKAPASAENPRPGYALSSFGHFIELQANAGRVGRNTCDGTRSIGTFELAERVAAEGFGDLVGMGRAQVSDAAFANKASAVRSPQSARAYSTTLLG